MPKNLFDKKAFALIILCVLTLFLFLGTKLFHTKGEPREALVAQAMINDGNWILPITNGVDIAYKPPLFHWSIASISSIVGEVNEYTSRMPSAIAATIMVMMGYYFYRKRRGAQAAFLAALLTLTNFEVHRAATNCRVDMLLAALMVMALYFLFQWYENRLRGVPWLAVLCLSGAFLSKGPVGVLLPCAVVGALAWIRGIGFLRAFLSMVAVVLGACVIPMLWYYAAWGQGGDKFLGLVYEENILRLLGKMTYASHENPWPYNVMTVITGFVPYTLFVVMSLFTLKYSRIGGKPRQWWNKFVTYIKTMDDVRLFSLLSIVIMFVFYCIPKSKRSVYLLPIYPFIAYFLAEYILYLVNNKPKSVRWFNTTIAVVSALVTIIVAVAASGVIPDTIFTGKHATENVAMLNALGDFHFVALPLIVAIVYFLKKQRFCPLRIACCSGILTAAIYIALDGAILPSMLNVKSNKPQAGQLASLAPTGKVYSFFAQNTEGNPLHPFTINFYIGNRMVPFESEMPTSGYVVIGEKDVDDFMQRYDRDYTISQIPNSRYRSCDTRAYTHIYHFLSKGNPKTPVQQK